jgi:hypothetical protein
MRSAAAGLALLVVVLIGGCAVATGEPAPDCDASWREVESLIVTPSGEGRRPVALDCIRQIDDRRIRIGFRLPPGPDCWILGDYDLVETADAVSVTLFVARHDDPNAGACAPEARRATTEIDLQAPVADRTLLDGSGATDRAGSGG